MTRPQKKLIDGQMVDSDSVEWLTECRARDLLKMSLANRRAWLVDYENKRGQAAADAIRDVMKKVFDANKQGRA
jgi:hypothetical protein